MSGEGGVVAGGSRGTVSGEGGVVAGGSRGTASGEGGVVAGGSRGTTSVETCLVESRFISHPLTCARACDERRIYFLNVQQTVGDMNW